MSGYVGMLHLDGRPIERSLIERLTTYLTFRGPDGWGVQMSDHIGFGHALLRVTDESKRERQPFSDDGRTWIVADARVDARRDLIALLNGHGHHAVAPDAPDVELILRAYRRWGEECVQYLVGDFSFAVWDAERRHLFCARDHLGVKPFYYAQIAQTLIFSNTLECVRLHPKVSADLNDAAIADFLLFGANQDAATTSFQDIRRLPAAHSITVSAAGTRCARYWTLPIDEPLFLTRADDYSARFVELLQLALRDRLRTRRVAVLMSGGLDSTTLAAVALPLLRESATDFLLQGVTSVYDRLIPSHERHYAGLVADHLKIPLRFDVRDDEPSIAEWDQSAMHTPEPVDNPPAFAASVAFSTKLAASARVFLYGEGPDNALHYEWRRYLSYLTRGGRLPAVARALWSELLMQPRVPLWSSIRGLAMRRRERQDCQDEFPPWLNKEFAARLNCQARWDAEQGLAAPAHPVRPVSYRGLSTVRWQSLFEDCDITGALSHSETRHPFLDLRVLRYMLALPAMPWCRNKLIIRRAMQSALPAAVLRRKKASVVASPDYVRVVRSGLPRFVPSPELLQYVDPLKMPSMPKSSLELRSMLRPLGLNYWLHGRTGN